MEQYGIQNIQVIPGTNPKQCIGIMYNGQRISTSAWVGHDFEAFFNEVKTGSCSVESVAKQKVSEAWGFTEEARQAHRDEQERTYADNINHLIQLKGRKISDVFNDYMHYQEMNNLLEYKQWIETVKAWYTEPETDFNGNIISQVSIEKGLARAKEFVLKTGCDSLAVAIGTSHGAYKFKGKQQLRFDISCPLLHIYCGFHHRDCDYCY